MSGILTVEEKEIKINSLKFGKFDDVNIFDWIRNYRFEYLYALIEGFNYNLNVDLMFMLVTNLNYLYNNPNGSLFKDASDLYSLYVYTGLGGQMPITEDYNSMINLWNERLKEIYLEMLNKIKGICDINKEKTSRVLELYNGLNIKLEEIKGPQRRLSDQNKQNR